MYYREIEVLFYGKVKSSYVICWWCRKSESIWTETLEFVVVSETPLAEDYVAVEVSPTKDAETSLTIMAKEFIEKHSPEVNLGTPSLMFKEKNFDALYSKLNDLGLTGHDIVEMNGQRVFNFQDGQGNYFAVSD